MAPVLVNLDQVSHNAASPLWDGEDSIDPGVAHTARWTAALRCIEHERPDGLLNDPLARPFAGEAALSKWRAEIADLTAKSPDGRNHIAIRSRALDDILTEELEDLRNYPKVQVVCIGAGMCTRAWRLEVPDVQVMWYEIDRPDSVQLKTRLIEEQGVQPPVASFCAIGVNFNEPGASLTAALEEHSFDASIPTIFVMEGFLPYLTKDEIQTLAEEIDDLVTEKGVLVMTCLNRSLLNEFIAPSREALAKYPGTKEISPMFHTNWEDDTQHIFESLGWNTESVISREDYANEHLGVDMLPYAFPVDRASTELIIVMRRKKEENVFITFLSDLMHGQACWA